VELKRAKLESEMRAAKGAAAKVVEVNLCDVGDQPPTFDLRKYSHALADHESSFVEEKKQLALRIRPRTRQQVDQNSEEEDSFDLSQSFHSIVNYQECLSTERRPLKSAEPGVGSDRQLDRKLRKGTEKRHSHQVDEAVFKRESLHTKSQSQENVTLTSGTYKKHKAKLVNAINHYRLPQEDSLSKKKG
jgi:hypothetical protein